MASSTLAVAPEDVDPQQLLKFGFVVVQVIQPAELDHWREQFEALVERQREIWAAERKPGDPPGGAY